MPHWGGSLGEQANVLQLADVLHLIICESALPA